MKYKLQIAAFLLFILFTGTCKKADQKTCWQLIDSVGNDLAVVCHKSENDMNAEYGGQYFFYRTNAPRYCWKLTRQPNTIYYVSNQPQAIIDIFYQGYTAEIVNCNSVCNWRVLYKHRSKITGNYTPTTLKHESIINVNDSCGKLFKGRIVTVSETADSIHTAEFVDQF